MSEAKVTPEVLDIVDAGSITSRETEARVQWGGKLEFILTCVGYAVGLGNVWRFPYLTYQNGGGAFLIPYIIMLVLVGFPVFFFELCFGQFSSQGPISCWKVSPIFKGVGVAMVACNWLIGMYYTIIVAWSFHFLFASFTSVLPWTDCENDWNSLQCITGPERRNLSHLNGTNLTDALVKFNATSLTELKTPSDEYFYKRVLQMSDSIEDSGVVVWELALCLLLTYVIVFLTLIKGIKSLGKVIYFVALFPYFMLTILVIRGATLEGAAEGVKFYLNPDLEKLGSLNVWSDAATMVFYSLSACTGGLIAMSSFNEFDNNCLRDSILVPTVTGFTSVYSGFAIFTVLGFMAVEKGVDVSEVAAEGPGLTFVVYPEALSQMPLPPLWSVLFFIMLLSLGFSSLFSIKESVFSAIMDEFPQYLRCDKYRPIIFRGVCITIYFLISLPMVSQNGFYLFSLTDSFVGGFPLLIIGLIELLSVFIFYGYQKFSEDIEIMLGKRPNIFFRITWVFVTPLVLFVCVIAKSVQYTDFAVGGYVLPQWAQALGWLEVSFVMIWIPGVAFVTFCKASGLANECFKLTLPTKTWGPARRKHRVGTKYDPHFNSHPVQDYEMGITDGPSTIRTDDLPDYSAVDPSYPTMSTQYGNNYDTHYDNKGFDTKVEEFKF